MEYFCCGGIGWHWVELRSIISSIRSSKRFAVQYLKHFIDVFTFCEKNSEKKKRRWDVFSLWLTRFVSPVRWHVSFEIVWHPLFIFICVYIETKERNWSHMKRLHLPTKSISDLNLNWCDCWLIPSTDHTV